MIGGARKELDASDSDGHVMKVTPLPKGKVRASLTIPRTRTIRLTIEKRHMTICGGWWCTVACMDVRARGFKTLN